MPSNSFNRELEVHAKRALDFRLAAKSESGGKWDANNIPNAGLDPGGYSFGGIQFNEENTIKFLRQLPPEMKQSLPKSLLTKQKGMTRDEAIAVADFFKAQMRDNPDDFKQKQVEYATKLTKKVRGNAARYYGADYESLPQNVKEFVTSVGINMDWDGNHQFILDQPLKRLKAGAAPEDVVGEMALRRSVAIGRAPKTDAQLRKNMVSHRTVDELKGELPEDELLSFAEVATPFNERIKKIIDSPEGAKKLDTILKRGNASGAAMQEISRMLEE